MHSQSISPSVGTSAAVCRSPISPWSAMSGSARRVIAHPRDYSSCHSRSSFMKSGGDDNWAAADAGRDDMSDKVDALVIFGATGDLAKLETFPALVGLVKRGVLDVPVVGVAKSGWGLEQFRDYAVASLKLNGMDPADPAAVQMLNLLRYVDGDLGDEATYRAMSDQIGAGQNNLYYMEVPGHLFGPIAQAIAEAGRSAGARVMVEKPFGSDLASSQQLNDTMHKYFDEESIFRVDDWLAFDALENMLFARFANSAIEPLR